MRHRPRDTGNGDRQDEQEIICVLSVMDFR